MLRIEPNKIERKRNNKNKLLENGNVQTVEKHGHTHTHTHTLIRCFSDCIKFVQSSAVFKNGSLQIFYFILRARMVSSFAMI